MGYESFINEAWIPRVQQSDLESEAAGLSIGRLDIPINQRPDGSHLTTLIADSGCDVTVVRYPSSYVSLACQLQHPDFAFWQADTLLYFESNHEMRRTSQIGVELEILDEDSDQSVRDLVVSIFIDYSNHYSTNPLLRRISVSDAYADWAVNALGRGDRDVYRATRNADLTIGLSVVDTSPREYDEVLLAGVRPNARRSGNYTAMLSAVINEASSEGKTVLISTQTHNVGVIRAWSQMGMLPTLSINTLHVVRREALNSHLSNQAKGTSAENLNHY